MLTFVREGRTDHLAVARGTIFVALLLLVASPGAAWVTPSMPFQETGSPMPADSFAWGRRGSPGDVHFLLLRRENRAVDRQGGTIGWTVAEGVMERTLLEEVDAGIWSERVRWTRYAFAEVQGSDIKPEPTAEDEASGLQFTVVTGRYSPGAIPDVSAGSLTGRSGSTLAILGLDAMTWDAFAGLLRQEQGAFVGVGSKAHHRGSGDSLTTIAPGTRYGLGEAEVEVRGITVVRGEQALLLTFVVTGSRLSFEGDLGAAQIGVNGTEYFTGWGAFSMADGRILEGELHGPLIATTELETPGTERAELPVGGAVQRVHIRELSPGER